MNELFVRLQMHQFLYSPSTLASLLQPKMAAVWFEWASSLSENQRENTFCFSITQLLYTYILLILPLLSDFHTRGNVRLLSGPQRSFWVTTITRCKNARHIPLLFLFLSLGCAIDEATGKKEYFFFLLNLNFCFPYSQHIDCRSAYICTYIQKFVTKFAIGFQDFPASILVLVETSTRTFSWFSHLK